PKPSCPTNATAPTVIHTLSLHDALPISRSSTMCGCIQAVANDTLSSSDQRRAVRFYSDPHLAQDVRQSSRDADKRFWKSYSDYGDRKSTRLNSSHVKISYAVFCLKKKNP